MSGVISPVTNTLFGQKAPGKYNQKASIADQKEIAQLQAEYGMFGVDSPLGKTDVRKTEDGTFERTFEQSEADEMRNQLISQGLGGVSLDPQRAESAYMDRATRLLEPKFEKQQESLDENLINRGIGIGSEQYGQRMGGLEERQQGTLSDLANQAVFAGQDYTTGQIGQTGQLAGQRDIYGLSSLASPTGSQFEGTYDKNFDSVNNRRMWQNQQNRAFMGSFTGGK